MRLRQRFASSDNSYALPTLICGVIGAGVALLIAAFDLLISALLALRGAETQLSAEVKSALILGSAVICWAVYKRLSQYQQTGTAHVIKTLQANPRRWPIGNAVMTFFMTPFLLAAGQPGGREGPAVHLGATFGAQFTHALRLPRNTLPIFTGAGAAAAISAMFDTPLAGIAFAMEVIVMEYSVAGFLPIIAASIIATLVMHGLFDQPPISFPDLSSFENPALYCVVIVGLSSGLVSAAFNGLMVFARRFQGPNGILWAGLFCTLLTLAVPEVMGTGDRHFEGILTGTWTVPVLLSLLIAKTLATSVSVGLGMPIGVISSLLTIGACLGVTWATLFGDSLALGLLGMVAVMGASLNAPLAALLAAVELSGEQAVIGDGLVAVAIAVLVHRGFGRSSFFMEGVPAAAQPRRSVLDNLGAEAALEPHAIQIAPRFKELPPPMDYVVWRGGSRQLKAVPWGAFVKAARDLKPGDSLESIENALTLTRADAQMTLAELARTAKDYDGCYLRDPDGTLAGLVLKTTIEERFS